MSDSSVYRNLCSRVNEKRKQFVVFTEIESVEISLRSIENKYVCRKCVAK